MKFVSRLLLPIVMVTAASTTYGSSTPAPDCGPLPLVHYVAGQQEPLLHTFASINCLKPTDPGFRVFLDELYNGSWDKKDELFLGYTPLHYAALAGNFDVASELLKAGANKDALVDGAFDQSFNDKKAFDLVPDLPAAKSGDVPPNFALKWLLEIGYPQ
jgi:hypothetical protein